MFRGSGAFAAAFEPQSAFTFQAGLASGIMLQEEVERWAARVKVTVVQVDEHNIHHLGFP